MQVAVELPRHSGLGTPLDYLSPQPLPVGTLLRVPLGARDVVGIVWGAGGDVDSPTAAPDTAALRPVGDTLDGLAPLTAAWCALLGFAAGYYQRAVGELALSVLPPELRKLDADAVARRMSRLHRWLGTPPPAATRDEALRPLSAAQSQAWQAWLALTASDAASALRDPPTVLLHGVTGSGKTELYLRAVDRVLSEGRQALVLVPEINLTPQLEARFASRFAGRRIVSLHSALTPAQRLRHWLAAHEGHADIVLGTRLAVFASMPRLGLIVVDEEHDPSYKQQEGARYSARDLAVFRGRLEAVPVMLGSATPSIETWQHALSGRYQRLSLPDRIGDGVLPQTRLVDMTRLPREPSPPVLARPLLEAMRERIARQEQCLVLLNRRGYAPVLHCGACGWKSDCPHCSAWRVFHKLDRSLRCHHCGFAERVPRACPECGNLDIAPIGRGTERLEEQLGEALGEVNGRTVRLARIDADTTRHRGALESQLQAVHDGEVDVLVGTQMIAKGHDFRRITLVAAVNPDGALFASDFRAGERLFALLMQAAGRAGRDAAHAGRSEMWLQTWHPAHPLYAALKRHDYEAYAASQLEERQQAGLPPFAYLALVRADAREAAVAEAFLAEAGERLRAWVAEAGALGAHADLASAVQVYPAVPPPVARVAGVERMQMLVESTSRPLLQRALNAWVPTLHSLRGRHRGLLRYAVDVDPLSI